MDTDIFELVQKGSLEEIIKNLDSEETKLQYHLNELVENKNDSER